MYFVQIWKDGWHRIAWDIPTEDAAITFANDRNRLTNSREEIRVRHTNKYGNVSTILSLNGSE